MRYSLIPILSLGLWLFVPTSMYASRLDNDPEVVHFDETDTLTLLVVKDTSVYATKKGKGSRRLGTIPVDTKVRLLGVSKNGYKVKGKAKHSLVTGWVSPQSVASTRPNFAEEIKKFYQRALKVRALIQAKEVAIGMTLSEVRKSLGEPTKKESRVTKDGRSGKWEFIKSKERKHYVTTIDPRTGASYRRFSHVTLEETENLTVEFEKNVVIVISRKEDNGAGNVKIVVPPIFFGF